MAFVLQNRARLCFEYFYDIGEKNPLSTFSTLRILRTLHTHAPSALSLSAFLRTPGGARRVVAVH